LVRNKILLRQVSHRLQGVIEPGTECAIDVPVIPIQTDAILIATALLDNLQPKVEGTCLFHGQFLPCWVYRYPRHQQDADNEEETPLFEFGEIKHYRFSGDTDGTGFSSLAVFLISPSFPINFMKKEGKLSAMGTIPRIADS